MTGEFSGSTAIALNDGLRLLITSLKPVIVPPVPTPRHEDVDLAVGVAPDLLGRRLAVNLRVGRVLELLRHEGVRRILDQLLGLGDGALHALLGRRQHDLGPERLEQPPPFQAHALGHGHDQLVAARGTGERQADAGVAAGRLDDDRVLVDLARRARPRRSSPRRCGP